jgi:cyanophycinase-like exopeptidase
MDKNIPGIVVLFGSGETLDTGRKIQRNILFDLPRGQHIAVVETPAGFQPNSHAIAQGLADVFTHSLKEFISDVTIVPARKKETSFSPDSEALLKPLENASYIVLGPGSPTYAARQLKGTKAWESIIKRWQKGATIVLSSAAAIAAGEHVLPVYEIYKVGSDYYWEEGLSLFSVLGVSVSILTHWNNNDGGKELDTSHCFMGKDRFNKVYELFPKGNILLCIDEHTAVIFNFKKGLLQVRGKGNMILILNGSDMIFENGKFYKIEAMVKGVKTEGVVQ